MGLNFAKFHSTSFAHIISTGEKKYSARREVGGPGEGERPHINLVLRSRAGVRGNKIN